MTVLLFWMAVAILVPTLMFCGALGALRAIEWWARRSTC
jgi:hypothetical protein